MRAHSIRPRVLVAIGLLFGTLAGALGPASPLNAVTVSDDTSRSRGQIAVVGDSLTAGAITDLGSRLGDAGFGALRIDAVVSRRMTKTSGSANSGISAIRSIRATGLDPGHWVIALGTNDFYESSSAMERMISEVLDEIGPGHVVSWMNVWMLTSTEGSERFNNALNKLQGRRSNLRVINWAASARQHSEWFASDGVHHNSTGLRARNAALVSGALGADAPVPPPTPTPPVEPQPAPPLTLTPVGPTLGFSAVSPNRVVDTRQLGSMSFGPGEVRRVDLASTVPPGARGAVVNLTAVGKGAPGYLSAWDCGPVEPTTSALNHPSSGARAAGAVVALDASGGFCVRSSVLVEVLVDVFGAWTEASGDGLVVSPQRVFDSRSRPSPHALTAGEIVRVPVGRLPGGGAPSAALVNLTTTNATTAGYLTAWPCGAMPEVSSLNYAAGRDIANSAWVPTSETGEICISASSGTDVVVDLIGLVGTDLAAARYQAIQPQRVIDSRSGVGGVAGLLSSTTRLGRTYVAEPGVAAVLETVTVTGSTGAGFVAVGPCVGEMPNVSTLNFSRSDDIANSAIANVSADGLGCHAVSQRTHLIVDIVGRFVTAG